MTPDDDAGTAAGIHRWVGGAARAMALAGGAALLVAMAVTLVSVVGGSVFGKPLLGDTEIVELLVGVAIACFMPYCQWRGANVIVDFFTMGTSARTRAWLDGAMTLVFAVIVAILTERLIDGAITQYARERASMFLQLPQWWGYGAAAVASLVWTVVTALGAWNFLRRAVR